MDKAQVYEILEEQYFGSDPHEQSELIALERLLNPNIKQIIDVGASLGQYTKAFAKLASQVSIIAIESDPIRIERLKHNCAVWAREYGADIRVVEAAANDVSGECVFYTTESNISGSFNVHGELSNSWKRIVVPAVTLDTVSNGFDNTFIKMDIEGGEYAALKGAEKLLSGSGNCFLIELHVWGDSSRNKKVGDVLDIFANHGYEVEKFHGHYYFSRTGMENRIPYLRIKVFFRLKELIYFSPLRGIAKWLNGIVKRLR